MTTEIKHRDTKMLVCPYCGKEHDGSKYDLSNEDEPFLCTCGKQFRYEVYTEYDTSADCELNGEAHDWYCDSPYAGKTDGKPYAWYRCRKCDKGKAGEPPGEV